MPTNVLDQQCPLHCTPRHLRDEDNSRINTVATHVVQTALEAHKLAGFILCARQCGNPLLPLQTITLPVCFSRKNIASWSFQGERACDPTIYAVSTPTCRITANCYTGVCQHAVSNRSEACSS